MAEAVHMAVDQETETGIQGPGNKLQRLPSPTFSVSWSASVKDSVAFQKYHHQI